jgi:type VII secretion protein EccB
MAPSFIPTTKLQVTGRKFLVDRLNHALTRHDTSMRHDPERSTSIAMMAAVAVCALVAGGALALAYFKPQGLRHDAPIVQSRESLELFVDIDGKLHPALNLVSARLIAGRPDEPALVKASEVSNVPRGQMVGIPGAPGRVFQPSQRDAVWAVCDVVDRPGMANPGVHAAVIAGDQQQRVGSDESAARIVQGPDSGTWLLHGGQRHSIDVGDAALVTGLGLSRSPVIATITRELFNAIPAGQPIGVPPIAAAGAPTSYRVGPGVVVGSVFRVAASGDTVEQWYVALADGVQQISPVAATVLRNVNTYGAPIAPTVSPDVVAHLPAASPGLDLSAFPPAPLHSVAVGDAPVTCWQWNKKAGEQQASAVLGFATTLPLTTEQTRVWRHDLVSRPGMSMYAPPGSGFYVQTTGAVDPRSPAAETSFWLSDAGVRYGLVAGGGTDNPAGALGLTSPLPVPWPVLAGLAVGPQLSKTDALVAHDTLAGDPAGQTIEGAR